MKSHTHGRLSKKENEKNTKKSKTENRAKNVVDTQAGANPRESSRARDVLKHIQARTELWDLGRDGGGGGAEQHVKSRVKVKPKDIRDKKNRYCDICKVTLYSRLLFLSHCSKVHAVKFRGKSGQPIVIREETTEEVISRVILNTPMDANNSKDEKEEEDEPQKENRAKDFDNCQCGDPLDYMCLECIYKRWKVEYDLVRIPIIIID